MFNTVITQIQGFLSKSFWFVSFLPVMFVAVLHLLLVVLTSNDPGLPPRLLALANDLVRLPLIVVGIVVVAYVLTPLVPLIRGILDASLLPLPIHDWLHKEHTVKVREISGKIDAAMDLFNDYGELNAKIQDVWKARNQGVSLNDAPDQNSITAADLAIGKIRKPVENVTIPPIKDANDAFEATLSGLRANSAELKLGKTPNQQQKDAYFRSQKIAALQKELMQLLELTETEAKHRWDNLADRHTMLALTNPQATRIADARLSVESYSFDVYNIDFDYLWPRLLACFKTGDGVSERVEALQDQVNFAVLLLALSLTVPLVWIPILVLTGHSIVLYLSVAALSTISIKLLYEFVAQAHVAFAAVVRTAIDFYRHDVLTKLKQPIPATLSGERMIWRALRTAAQSSAASDLSYRQP